MNDKNIDRQSEHSYRYFLFLVY